MHLHLTFIFYSNILQCVLHCESILGHWVVRKLPNHIVRSIPSHVGTRKHQVDSWPSLPVCIHENIHLYFSDSDIRLPRGHRVHNPNSSIQCLYWSLYCTPMVSVYSLSLSGLDVFTKQGKSVSWGHMFTIWPGYNQ